MKKTLVLSIAFVISIASFALADTFSTGDNAFSIDFVPIGNPRNAADTGGTPGCGAVGYNYRIGKYEVTNTQWNAFTTAVGDPVGNAYFTGALQPTNNVSWYEAAQFCNYLTSGNKYSGAYKFDISGNFQGIDRASSILTYGTTYVIPTGDEWYKAAYCKPDGSSYSLYAFGTNTAPIAGVQSNYDGSLDHPWNVGSGTPEQNGTYDMMGNVWEWNETIPYDVPFRGVRGGSHQYYGWDPLASYPMGGVPPDQESGHMGFRVASIVPEPTSLLLLGLGGLLIRRK